jgi:chromosome segregation ATPase
MDKIIALVKKIETDYGQLDNIFTLEIESRNKKAFEHISLLKAIKALISEVKNDILNMLVPLNSEIIEKKKELDVLYKKISEEKSKSDEQKKLNEKITSEQDMKIRENDLKIKKTEDSINGLIREKDDLNDRITEERDELGLIQNLSKDVKSEVTTLEMKRKALELSVGSLTQIEEDKKKSIKTKNEDIVILEKRIIEMSSK